jgi:hypothetical protein
MGDQSYDDLFDRPPQQLSASHRAAKPKKVVLPEELTTGTPCDDDRPDTFVLPVDAFRPETDPGSPSTVDEGPA